MLITESPGRLPATIVSRCQRLRINRPTRAESVGWLNSIDTTADWEALLDFALDAPLVALDLHRKGFAAQAARYRADLRELRQRGITPLAIAQRWAAADAELLLRWLYRQLAAEAAQEAAGLQNQMNQLNMRQALRQLRRIEEAYRNRDKALNRELQLAALLTDWYGATANPN
jgi:DNA polymerase-3 subunit delta'